MNRSRRTRDRWHGDRRPPRAVLLESSDERLVELVLDGHDPAFEVLFERHVADALWFAREALGTWEEAEEAVRHSFAAAHAYLAARGRETEFGPWLHTILGNHCLSMLQARLSGPGERSDAAAVVDLDEWRRRRRKRFGVALPIAPSAALHDGVMTACGIGGGAATSGAAMGGMLAKVAVVAVLAGGVGVAGNVAPDRGAPADAGTGPPVERTANVAAPSPIVAEPVTEPSGRARRVSRATTVRELGSDGGPRASREGLTPRERDRVAAGQSPSEPASATPRAPGPATAVAPTAGQPPPVRTTLRGAADTVAARVPAVAKLPKAVAGLPAAVGLSKIGDDLGVAVAKPPIDVQALLSQGRRALPK